MEESRKISDFFDHPHYRLVKVISILTGEWPLENKIKRFFIVISVIISSILYLTIQTTSIIYYSNDAEALFALIPTTIVGFASCLKFSNYYFFSTKIAQLLKFIEEEWNIMTKEESEILDKYANIGRILALGYTVLTYWTVTMFISQPFSIYSIESYFNISITSSKFEGFFPLPIYASGLESGKYKYLTLIIFDILLPHNTTLGLAHDVMLVILVLHACGRFAGLGYRLGHLPVQDDKSKKDGFEYLCKCAITHNRILNFSENLKSLYFWYFLSEVVFMVMCLSLTGAQVVTQKNEILELIKLAVFTLIQMVHLFFQCYLSQQLINHSLSIQESINDGAWYHNSVRTQKLLVIMTMRSQRSCSLTAGTSLEICMATMAAILRTTASYFTMFLAMR